MIIRLETSILVKPGRMLSQSMALAGPHWVPNPFRLPVSLQVEGSRVIMQHWWSKCVVRIVTNVRNTT